MDFILSKHSQFSEVVLNTAESVVLSCYTTIKLNLLSKLITEILMSWSLHVKLQIVQQIRVLQFISTSFFLYYKTILAS